MDGGLTLEEGSRHHAGSASMPSRRVSSPSRRRLLPSRHRAAIAYLELKELVVAVYVYGQRIF